MLIQINHKLTKSRNPVEHGFKLEGQVGELIQVVGDGYNLVKFKQFEIKKQVNINRKTSWEFTPLEWYIHDMDFFIKQ